MLVYSEFDPSKKAFVFELDNVLYPERDYLLQVYYLFANFLEYSETFPPAVQLTEFFKKAYEHAGPNLIFDKAREAFGISEKYRENFLRLHRQAQLPLKLLLFDDMLKLLQDIVIDRKEIFIVTAGDPVQQLNKIRQIEWNGLEKYLRVYFTNEVKPKPSPDVLLEILKLHNLEAIDVLVAGVASLDAVFAENAGIDFVKIEK
ncbi:phosphoglycolate phosphatase-like HAD superfamily hydrolase [Arcticibacter tournemirensis]|uniref:HAD family hydrolase n=1 Tax=Arcticibacter tournemirensis TaxID=699437 RepID=A0A5M9HIF1_9SPHI|nr:HAD hydrolase-like protein [Arcticibacter tournemirensis]KAA8486235.1 HAD family hydrolase [Arcticibacter tournemirensis]TQM52036.1 phosphoglycolate phosphatase-like HAD superfamily hydrolase [Arcticibacter tournemirensis]